MITKIEVDGFKSLCKFDLELKPGLNILVGPNGAGKTNIILFFEFLTNLVNNPIGNAISNVGGAGTIFKKIGKDKYVDSIDCKIYGSSKYEKKFIEYEYSFRIKISFEKDDVFYERQELKVKTVPKFSDKVGQSIGKFDWDVHIISGLTSESKLSIDIKSYDRKKLKDQFFNDAGTVKEFHTRLKTIVAHQNPAYQSLVRCLVPFSTSIHPLMVDLRGGETFNVIPSKVRELEDSATTPGIKKDGSGLSTTLYAMKKSKTKSNGGMRYWGFIEDVKEYNPKTLDQIIRFLKTANETIKSVDVDNDPFNNKLIVKISISSGDYDAVLPLSAMSDGTVKWLTLITAILTSKTIFSIEEPENFLHPWMQAEIAKIMRNHLVEKETEAFVLMTTHSESLLNNANPEEIIIVGLQNGATIARRISNLQAVKEEISNTGAGLGYFYFSNALNND